MGFITEVNKLIVKVNRLSTVMGLLSLSRNYADFPQADIDRVTPACNAVFDLGWNTEDQAKYWSGALRSINRFWAESYDKGGDGLKRVVAIAGIAKIYLDAELQAAWVAAVLYVLHKRGYGVSSVFFDQGAYHIRILHEDRYYYITPAGVLLSDDPLLAGINCVPENRIMSTEESDPLESFVKTELNFENHYFAALAVAVGILDHLDSTHVGSPAGWPWGHNNAPSLVDRRNRLMAIEALLIARNPTKELAAYAPGLSFSLGSLYNTNLGPQPVVPNLIVQGVPLDVANHRFIVDHAFSMLARKLHEKNYDIADHQYPELAALVSSMAVVVNQTPIGATLPILNYNEEVTTVVAAVIYGLAMGTLTDFEAFCKDFQPSTHKLIRSTVDIMTVVSNEQIR